MKPLARYIFILVILVTSCKKEVIPVVIKKEKPAPVFRYGYNLENYTVIEDTIESGESFGIILDRHHVLYPKINTIAAEIKNVF